MRPDPRPVVVPGERAVIAGRRCDSCAYPTTDGLDRCPECGGRVEPASFGPDGTVFASTTVHIAPAGLEPPYTLAYVDFDGGPRLLVHVAHSSGGRPAPGERVRLLGVTDRGDPLVTGVGPS